MERRLLHPDHGDAVAAITPSLLGRSGGHTQNRRQVDAILPGETSGADQDGANDKLLPE